jgi:hypothetical protein
MQASSRIKIPHCVIDSGTESKSCAYIFGENHYRIRVYCVADDQSRTCGFVITPTSIVSIVIRTCRRGRKRQKLGDLRFLKIAMQYTVYPYQHASYPQLSEGP